MRIITLISAIILFCTSCKRQELITEQEAITAIQNFDKGWEKKDAGAVDSVLSPRYIYFTKSGRLFSRDSIVATAGQPGYYLDSMNRSEFEVTISGSTAVVSTRWEGIGVYRGSRFAENQRCSITLVKEAGKVRILSEHCTPIKKQPRLHLNKDTGI